MGPSAWNAVAACAARLTLADWAVSRIKGEPLSKTADFVAPWAWLVVDPVEQPGQAIGADGANRFSGFQTMLRVLGYPFAEGLVFVRGFGIASEEPERNDKQAGHDGNQQRAFAFPGFHGGSLAWLNEDSTTETE